MWLFGSKKTFADSGLLNGLIDNHCHLLPGVDDGVRSMEETLTILSDLESRGVKEVWLTPHTMEDMPNTTEELKEKFHTLQEEYHKASEHPLKLHLSSEYMLDSLFESHLSSGDLLLHRDNMVLVETSYVSCPYNFKSLLNEIKRRGHYPLLAHPERYLYMEDMREYDELKDMNIRFQLNISSITGCYGGMVQKTAIQLLKKGYYEYVGSDTHSFRYWQRAITNKALSSDTIKRLSTLMATNNKQ